LINGEPYWPPPLYYWSVSVLMAWCLAAHRIWDCKFHLLAAVPSLVLQ
jgi:hypothetical protein